MKVHTFKNGIFLKENRRRTKKKGITPVLPKGDMIYPLLQLSGIPAIPIVQVGDYVYKGQKIAEAPGVSGAPIHASVSGKIKTIEPNFVPEGARGNCIIIENDGEYKELEPTDTKSLEELTRLEILDRIDEAGIVNLGEDERALKEKLCPKDPDKIQYVVMNGTEEEPYFTANYRRMVENANEIIGGMKCVLSLFENAKGILLVEENNRKCIKKLKKALKHQKNINIKTVKAKYPQISEVGNADENVVLNVETLIAIQDAVLYRKPVTERVLTVSGECVEKPGNYKVLLGTNLKHLLEDVCIKDEVDNIILGGAMRGVISSSWDVPITKEFPSILCLAKDNYAEREPSACIQCGRCVEACPKQLVPTKLARYADKGRERRFLRRKGPECIGCGACNYVCPAKRHLKQAVFSNETGAPYMKSRVTTTRIMLWVLLSLMPTTLFGVIKYGLPALGVLFVTVTTAIHSELIWQLILKKKITVGDMSAVVTGVLLGLNLPSNTPLWICALGTFFAVVFLKQLFGALGKNIINPAMGAKALLLILFSNYVATSKESYNLLDAFIGNVDATIGGTSVICILLGATLLLVKGFIDIRIPGMCLLLHSIIVILFGGHGFDIHYLAETLCNGDFLLAVWFMATDYSTSPITKLGKVIYGAILGVLSGVFAVLGYVNAIPFVIVVCNLMVPFLELVTLPRTSLKKETE